MGSRNDLSCGALLLATALQLCSPAAAAGFGASSKKPRAPSVGVDCRNPSSAVFPIHGDVYPHGQFYVSMSIGDPPKPYFLDIDTGSDLTWLRCDTPCVSCSKGPHPLYRLVTSNLVPFDHPLCTSLQSSTLQSRQNPGSPNKCDYKIEYADHSSSIGVLVTDAFVLPRCSLVRPHLAFGCGCNQQESGANSPSPTDGVLGLGRGKLSILSQLRDQGVTRSVVGHCLGRGGARGGYLFFGDGFVPSNGVTWVPMSRSDLRYSPGSAHLFLGKQSLGVRELQVVIDSGSTYTYFANQPYQAFLTAVKNDLSKKPLEASDDPALAVCWKGPKPFKSVLDVKKYFSSLVLVFGSGKRANYLEIPPENYLIITKHGNACLGILDGTEVGIEDFNLIGDVSLQDLMVVYDNEKQQIGWIRASCDSKSGTSPL